MSVSFFFHPDEIEVRCQDGSSNDGEIILFIKDNSHSAAFFGGVSDMHDLAAAIVDAVATREPAENQ